MRSNSSNLTSIIVGIIILMVAWFFIKKLFFFVVLGVGIFLGYQLLSGNGNSD